MTLESHFPISWKLITLLSYLEKEQMVWIFMMAFREHAGDVIGVEG